MKIFYYIVVFLWGITSVMLFMAVVMNKLYYWIDKLF